MSNKITFEKFCAFFFIFLIALGLYAFYIKIYYPSHISVLSACKEITDAEALELGFYTGGIYNITTNETINYINESLDSIAYKQTDKHEQCHKIQDMNGRLDSYCNRKIRFHIDEMECKLAGYYPDWLYNKFYNS